MKWEKQKVDGNNHHISGPWSISKQGKRWFVTKANLPVGDGEGYKTLKAAKAFAESQPETTAKIPCWCERALLVRNMDLFQNIMKYHDAILITLSFGKTHRPEEQAKIDQAKEKLAELARQYPKMAKLVNEVRQGKMVEFHREVCPCGKAMPVADTE